MDIFIDLNLHFFHVYAQTRHKKFFVLILTIKQKFILWNYIPVWCKVLLQTFYNIDVFVIFNSFYDRADVTLLSIAKSTSFISLPRFLSQPRKKHRPHLRAPIFRYIERVPCCHHRGDTSEARVWSERRLKIVLWSAPRQRVYRKIRRRRGCAGESSKS